MTNDEILKLAMDTYGKDITFEASINSDNRKCIEFQVINLKEANKLGDILPTKFCDLDVIITYFTVDIEEMMSRPLE